MNRKLLVFAALLLQIIYQSGKSITYEPNSKYDSENHLLPTFKFTYSLSQLFYGNQNEDWEIDWDLELEAISYDQRANSTQIKNNKAQLGRIMSDENLTEKIFGTELLIKDSDKIYLNNKILSDQFEKVKDLEFVSENHPDDVSSEVPKYFSLNKVTFRPPYDQYYDNNESVVHLNDGQDLDKNSKLTIKFVTSEEFEALRIKYEALKMMRKKLGEIKD